jgi:RNA polymerase sigma factor (sigma-70 family)
MSSNASSGSLSRYYKEVEATRMLGAEEERELILLYKKTKDPRAKDKILKGALRYVISEARKHPRSLMERTILEDLIAAGNIGLLRALNKFDTNAGTRFLTYASWWVRHEMREEGRRLGLVHVPAHAMAKGAKSPNTTEFNEAVTSEMDILVEDCAIDIDMQQSMLKLFTLTNLSVREVFIVKASFGIHTAPKTLKQIGRILEITGERVRQLRESAVAKLRSTAARMRDESDDADACF